MRLRNQSSPSTIFHSWSGSAKRKKREPGSGLSVRAMPVSEVPKVWTNRARGNATRSRASNGPGMGSVPYVMRRKDDKSRRVGSPETSSRLRNVGEAGRTAGLWRSMAAATSPGLSDAGTTTVAPAASVPKSVFSPPIWSNCSRIQTGRLLGFRPA